MGESSWVIQLSEDFDKTIESSRSLASNWQDQSIYKLPKCVTGLNPNAYNPHVVSFGPYHHGAPHLKPMEQHKCRALRKFIDRVPGKTSRELVGAVSEVVTELKECYDSLDPMWRSDEHFVMLMILDGCFMLEVLRTWTWKGCDSVAEYAHNDPIFSGHGKVNILPFIRRDMLLLENQLPMLLLDTLIAFETDHNKERNHESTKQLILEFYQCRFRVPDNCVHVLDVHRKSLTHRPPRRRPVSMSTFELEDAIGLPTATELHESGLKFKVSDSNSLTDISFDRGVLKLPVVVVDDTTESMFLNFIAFERFHFGAITDVVSYLLFMDRLIHSERDVALLRSNRIIHNVIGSDKEVARLFNSLSRYLTVPGGDEDHFTVLREVNHYRKKRRNAWRAYVADLKNTYFRSPWASISVVAAVLLFALTFTQTFYTVFPKK